MSSIKSDKDRIYSSQFLATLPANLERPQVSMPTLSIFNSLTGRVVVTNSYKFSSLDNLKEFISSCFGIPSNLLFILTPFGIKLRFSMVLHDQISEIYVFDRSCFNIQGGESGKLTLVENLQAQEPGGIMRPAESPLLAYPGFKADNLRGSVNALKRNSGWAAAILSDFKKIQASNIKEDEDSSIEVILRSANVLIQYLSLTAQTLQKNFDSSIEFYNSLQENSLITRWEDHFKILKKISFNLAGRELNLSNSISRSELSKTAKEASLLSGEVEKIIQATKDKLDADVIKEKKRLEENYNFLRHKYHGTSPGSHESSTEAVGGSHILKLESLVQEIVDDVNYLPPVGPDPTDSSIQEVQRCYERHLDELVPEISHIALELYGKHSQDFKNKRQLQHSLFDYIFNDVAKIQISLINTQKLVSNDLQPKLQSLQNLEIRLSIVHDLPLIFGLLLIYKYKNYKWFQNFKKICFRTNEILEMLQFLETNSRTKWIQKFLGKKESNYNLNESYIKPGAVAEQYQDFLGVMKQEDFINENLPVAQLLFESKQNGHKFTIDPSHIPSGNKALSKFINSLNTNLTDPGYQSDENRNVWNEIAVTNIKDIQNYLEILHQVLPGEVVVQKLEKNLEDLGLVDENSFDINDQNFMKFYRKFLKSYEIDGMIIECSDKSSPAEKSKLIQTSDQTGNALIKGYENRVRKLENLLHQQQFLQFNQDFKPRRALNPMNFGTLNEAGPADNRAQILLPHNRKFSTDSSKSEDTSLKDENVRLADENARLQDELEKLKEELMASKAANTDLMNQNENLKQSLDNDNEALKIDMEKHKAIAKQNYEEVNSMKNDLIDNMASLQKDHEEERAEHLQEISNLKFDIEGLQHFRDELQDQNAKFAEVISDKNQVIEGLSNVVESMYMKLKEMSKTIYVDLMSFCVVLESIGLLLTEEDGEAKIIRVKGLKKGKDEGKRISSEFVPKVEKHLYWTDIAFEHETTSVKDMMNNRGSSPAAESSDVEPDTSISELDIRSKSLVHKFDNSAFESNYQGFIDSIDLDTEMLIDGIVKRFKDVENLARKFQKDLGNDKLQMEKLSQLVSSKISIRNFQANDLVLFLPTTDEFNKNGTTLQNQWAAFNVGAPHYFLNNEDAQIDLSRRDWLVARVVAIEEFQITDDNHADSVQNPFNLGVGVRWYSVKAKEQLD